jgi:tetratricopeptide (TPR) repeat protein
MMKHKNIYLIILLLIVVCIAAFGPIAGNGFINFDDPAYVTENNHIKSGLNLETIKWSITTTYFSYWHPLTWLSHTLDWSLFGTNAGGHHLVSLLWHIGTVIFLFLFLNKTTNNIWPSAFAAALFALHPLRVESVAWASERKDVLSMFFAMACLYAYAFYVQKNNIFKYLLCLTLFALALMSKPMMVTLPFVLMLLDYWPLNRWPKALDGQGKGVNSAGGLILEKVPFICLTIAACILTFWAQNKEGIVASVEVMPFPGRVNNAILSYAAYLWKTIWPFNLAVFYPYELSLPLWKVLLSGIILILITLAALYYIRKLPFLFAGWFIYLGTLVPVIGLVQVGSQSMADRYTYMPSMGIAFILAWGIPYLVESGNIRRKVLFPAGVALIIFLSALTWRQCGYWKNSFTLFNHALKSTKNNYLIHNNLGVTFFKDGNFSKALYHYSKAISIVPNYDRYYNNRGDVYARIGMYQSALTDFIKAISLNPDYTEAYYNRGLTYDKIGQYQPAIEDYNKVISLRNDYVDAYNGRGIIYAKLDQYQQAIDDFNKAISIRPDYAYAYSNRGILNFSHNKNESGCLDAQKVCELGNCMMLKTAREKGLCR